MDKTLSPCTEATIASLLLRESYCRQASPASLPASNPQELNANEQQ
ncbi:hypothetical protein [Kalamiella sp. sgz302252]